MAARNVRGKRTAYIRGRMVAADPPELVPRQPVLMDTAAAVHISPKQLYCFSHNEGARVRSDRGSGRIFTGISRVPRRTTT